MIKLGVSFILNFLFCYYHIKLTVDARVEG